MGSANSISRFGALGALLLFTQRAQEPAQEFTTLIGTMGIDTVAVDRFVRDEQKLEGVLLVRRPEPHTMHYNATLAPGGRFTRVELTWRDATDTDIGTATISFGVDSIRSELRESATEAFGAPSSLDAIPLPQQPYAIHAYAFLEHAAIAAWAGPRNRAMAIEWILVGDRNVREGRIRRAAGDTLDIDFVTGRLRVHLAEDGRVDWLSHQDGRVMTVVHRSTDNIDLTALATSFACRETAGPLSAIRASRCR